MNFSRILQSGFIGAATGLLIVLIVLLWKKEPASHYPKALLKAAVNGFLLGCVGCVVSFWTAQILSEWIQNTVLLLGCVFGLSFLVGMLFGALLEKALWSRVFRNA